MSAWQRFDVQAPPCDGWYELRWSPDDLPHIVLCRRVSADPGLTNAEQWQWSWSSEDDWESLAVDEPDPGAIEWRPASPEWLAHVAENL
jgi:hypothetical protein